MKKSVFFLVLYFGLGLYGFAQSWEELNKKGTDLHQASKYEESLPILEKARRQAEKEFGRKHENYATSCHNLANSYQAQRRYTEAEPLYKEAKDIREKTLGKNHPDYTTSCDNLAWLYHEQGRYSEAESLYKEAKDIREKNFGKDHPDYAASCYILAWLYYDQGRYTEAETLFKEAKDIREKIFGKNHTDYASSCNILAALYYEQGRYNEAELLFKEAKNIWEKVFGKNHPDYASACHNLALLYYDIGRYAEAETLYKESQNINEKIYGKLNLSYAVSCVCLAMLYQVQGRYTEAEILYKETKNITAKVIGEENRDYANSCNHLANFYYNQGRYIEAEPLYKEANEIWAKTLGKEHPDYATSCSGLASLYQAQRKYTEAETLFKEAQNIYVKAFGKNHPNYANSCDKLAQLYQEQGHYTRAEIFYKEAKDIYAKVVGSNHPDYAYSCNNLASLYKEQGRYTDAEPLFKEASQTLLFNIQRNFVGLSEKEKAQYLATFQDNFEKYFSFALKAQKPALAAWLLENNLITKGLLFFSTNQLRRSLEKSQDKNLKETYEKWLAARKELSKAYEMGETKRQEKKIDLQSLESKANELEKTLSLALSQNGIEAELTPKPRSWQEIKDKLKKQEALVELTRIRYYDKKWTDSVLYVALIVKKDSPYPEMLVLPNGKTMEKEDINFYRNSIRLRKQDKESYKVFFQPLQKALKGIKKVYFSGDGIYHQINLATLYNPENKKFLGEELDIQVISTARDFLRLGKKELKSYTENYRLSLFGYPDFSGEKTKNAQGTDRAVTDVALVSRIDKKQRFFDELSGTVTYLPGTKKEVETIQDIAQKAKTRTEVYLEEKASEENLKAISSPAILHIASHGFFIEAQEEDRNKQEENKRFDNPLLRAGLLLAGAELALKKQEIPSKENGILTAQEAMNLDLQGTDLVVLSACETGLGEIRNGEGVFGLQRALQEAGAKSVLMSLWKVDDAATQEMMTLFYENMLLKKQNKRTAFQNAQETMKKKYKEPYYWGAFVMVGE